MKYFIEILELISSESIGLFQNTLQILDEKHQKYEFEYFSVNDNRDVIMI